MSQPGWYPDPSGSGTPRYWDGSAWSKTTISPATSAGRGRRPGGSSLLGVGIGIVVILLVAVALVWQPWRSTQWASPEDDNSAKPTGSQWNELEPTETPSSPQPTDGDGRPVACPLVDEGENEPKGAWYVSGDIQYKGVPGWVDGGAWTIDFASDRSGQVDEVSSGWVSITAIGQISTQDFSTDPRTAANQLSDCMSSSYYYRTLDQREKLQDEAFTTSDGVSGWIIRENYWNVPNQPVTGDEVVVVVLQVGTDDSMTMFHSQAPIEDERRKDKVADALSTLSRR
ncbi:MAG: DUF2510 domain-containing protein [Propionibacteriaceae bacterium]|nr:DUF2510 domain-containing protein [Propionibacteriaceae bacterium]